MELNVNMIKPQITSLRIGVCSESLPDSKMNGIIIKEGSDSSICSSNSDTLGNALCKSSKIGDIANPGKDVTIAKE